MLARPTVEVKTVLYATSPTTRWRRSECRQGALRAVYIPKRRPGTGWAQNLTLRRPRRRSRSRKRPPEIIVILRRVAASGSHLALEGRPRNCRPERFFVIELRSHLRPVSAPFAYSPRDGDFGGSQRGVADRPADSLRGGGQQKSQACKCSYTSSIFFFHRSAQR